MNTPIDFVVMWVDGNDRKWKTKKEFHQNEYGILKNNDERFRDWDNLQFVLRSFEKHAPWVNKIYLVTDDQTPDWINKDSSKLVIVDHKDFLNQEYLPTFNSHAIELNLHKIPNLSENFVLFNDDMLLRESVEEKDFFIDDVPVDCAALSPILPRLDYPIGKYIFNNLALINQTFNKKDVIKEFPRKWFSFKNGTSVLRTIFLSPWNYFPGFYEPHLAYAYNKSTFVDVWENHYDVLHKTSLSKFRQDHNVNQWVMRYWQLARNNFIPHSDKFGSVHNLSTDRSVKDCIKELQNGKSKIICINDTEDLINFESAKNEINFELRSIFNQKSTFEKE